MLKVPPQGDPRSRIYLVGEAPGEKEEVQGIPFIGASGEELDRQLEEVGINRRECYVTNVCKYRPPNNEMDKWVKRNDKTKLVMSVHPLVQEGIQELKDDISGNRPQLVIGFGNTPLWALSGEWGITAWRGSEMLIDGGVHFVPTLHPAAILRAWDQRPSVIHDLRARCVRRLRFGFQLPAYHFNTNPTFEEVMEFIHGMHDFAADIESSRGKVVCIGLARDAYNAICIPFWNYAGRYWTHEEEDAILYALAKHQGGLIGQNWNYDRQYIANDFGVELLPAFDTYIAQSVLFPGNPRDLGYLSSMYCDHHVYWKEDGKDWNNIKDFPKLFRYNCTDACRTYEVAQVTGHMLETAGLTLQFRERMKYANHVYDMMRRGVNRAPDRTAKIIAEVDAAVSEREKAIEGMAGRPINFGSPKQVGDFLFKQLGYKPTAKTAKGAASTKDEALQKLIEKNPEASAACLPILEARSLANIKANFLQAELDPDGRLRSSWMATGTETFRLTSGKNAYHRGGPLQNITDGKHTHSGRSLPNLRSTIVPPAGCIYWNCDLERADLQVVAWEAEDDSLKHMLKAGIDVHLANAIDLFDIKGVPLDECVESHSRYREHKEKHEQPRHFAKTFCHLTNYGGQARTCATKTHSTVHKADGLQKRWFEIHPGILRWHRVVGASLRASRTVFNRFGYRRVYFDRIDSCFTEALAWIPQSTVSLVISYVHMNIEDELVNIPVVDFGIELQAHDSIAGFLRPEKSDIILPRMYSAARRVVVPYDDPLIIPLELALSDDSWGEVRKVPWPTGSQTS